MENKYTSTQWLAYFALKRPACMCGSLLRVTKVEHTNNNNYLLLQAHEDDRTDTDKSSYVLYNIEKEMVIKPGTFAFYSNNKKLRQKLIDEYITKSI